MEVCPVKIGLVPLVAPVSGPRALGTHAALEALAGEFDFAVVSPDEMGAADLPAFLIRTGARRASSSRPWRPCQRRGIP